MNYAFTPVDSENTHDYGINISVDDYEITSVGKPTAVNNGAEIEIKDYRLYIDTAKHITTPGWYELKIESNILIKVKAQLNIRYSI